MIDNEQLRPVFIIGFPRSGSKLIRGLLNNNKAIFFPKAEALFLSYFVKKYGLTPEFQIKLNRNKIIKDISNSTYISTLDISREEIDNETFSQILQTNLWSVIFRYLLNDLPDNKKKNLFFGDKSPNNLNYVGLLKEIYPTAKFIHMIRDPRDQALSSRILWGKSLYRNSQSWRDSIKGVRDVVTKNNIQYLEIRYEDLIKDTALILNKVCEFIGCHYSKEMLELQEPTEGKGVHSYSMFISKNNLNKFKDQLNDREIRKIEELTLDVLSTLDYDLLNNNISLKRLNLFERLIYKLYDSYRIISFHILAKGIIKGLRYAYYSNKHK